jgi:hypothetical protein
MVSDPSPRLEFFKDGDYRIKVPRVKTERVVVVRKIEVVTFLIITVPDFERSAVVDLTFHVHDFVSLAN